MKTCVINDKNNLYKYSIWKSEQRVDDAHGGVFPVRRANRNVINVMNSIRKTILYQGEEEEDARSERIERRDNIEKMCKWIN